MKSMKTSIVLLSAMAVCAAVRAGQPEAGEGTPVDSRITEVTVFADRAQVTRVGKIALGDQVSRVSFAKLPAWIDEGSVRVALSPGNAGQILDVEIERTFLAHADDAEVRRAEMAAQDILDQIAALDDEKHVLEAEDRQIDNIKAFSLEKFPKDVASREVKIDEYHQSVEFVASGLRKLAQEKREIERKHRELDPELKARQRALN